MNVRHERKKPKRQNIKTIAAFKHVKEYNTNQGSFILVKVANAMGKKHNQKQPLKVFWNKNCF